MLRTFNLGAGLIAGLAPELVAQARTHLATQGYDSAIIGEIVASDDPAASKVGFSGAIGWE